MDKSATLTEIASLSIEDRIDLVEAIWDTIAAAPEELKLTAAQKRELERRQETHAANPDNVVPWEEVKARALARIG
jgi:putative addiction module component (TIGR02574 family)